MPNFKTKGITIGQQGRSKQLYWKGRRDVSEAW